ncbi:MAG: FliM/FliN family flagellar motor switch protein [Myxococcota bacterium]
MADLLTDEERDALQDSIQSTGRSRERAPSKPPEPTPVALIADDQATEKVRPAALRIAERWSAQLRRLIPPACGAKVAFEVDDAVHLESHEIVEELTHNWLGMVKPGNTRGTVLVGASGSMIPELAARILGGKYDVEGTKAPTSATLRVFGKIGQQIVIGLLRALEQEQGGEPVSTTPPKTAETWSPLVDGAPLVMVRLNVTGEAEGVVRFVSAPDSLAVARRAPPAPRTDPRLVRAVLGDVPVDISVELGTTTMRASEFAELQPGAVLRLDSLIGDPLPVRVGGRLHAVGSAVLNGEVIAVEIGKPSDIARQQEETA